MNCTHCSKLLNQSQYHENLKSCPNCSTKNGSEHVFYRYPEAFGNTPKRETSVHPDGPQSHCTACRGGQDQTEFSQVLCSNK